MYMFISIQTSTSENIHFSNYGQLILRLMQFQFSTSFIEHVHSYISIFLVILWRIEVAAWFDPTTDVKGSM